MTDAPAPVTVEEWVAWARGFVPPAQFPRDDAARLKLLYDLARWHGIRAGLGEISIDEAYGFVAAACGAVQVDSAGAWGRRRTVQFCFGIVDEWAARVAWIAEERDAAAGRVAWAVRPLFRARAEASDIEAAARRAMGPHLTWEDAVAVLRQERMAATMRRRP